MPFKSRRSLLAALCLSALVPPLAHAQSQTAAWPAKPIRIVVAYPAGGVSDTVARALADKLAVQLEQQAPEKQQIQTRFDAELEQLRRLWPQPEPR